MEDALRKASVPEEGIAELREAEVEGQTRASYVVDFTD